LRITVAALAALAGLAYTILALLPPTALPLRPYLAITECGLLCDVEEEGEGDGAHKAQCRLPHKQQSYAIQAIFDAAATAKQCAPNSYQRHSRWDSNGSVVIECPRARRAFAVGNEQTVRSYDKPVALDGVEVVHTWCDRRPPPRVLPEEAADFIEGWAGNTPPLTPQDFDRELLVRVARRDEVGARCAEIASRREAKGEPAPLHITVLFVDSLSRLGFWRHMPQTAALLRAVAAGGPDRADEDRSGLGDSAVFEFALYHSLAESTNPNMAALFGGLPFPRCRWSRISQRATLEECGPDAWFPSFGVEEVGARTAGRWLAGILRDLGYVTAIAAGECVTYNVQATPLAPDAHSDFDHALLAHWCDRDAQVTRLAYQPGVARCLAGRHMHEYSFDYLHSLAREYPEAPRATVAVFNEAHEPTQRAVAPLDARLAEFLKHKLSTADGNRSVIFLVADHGINYGLTRPFGGAEEVSLPALFLLLPRWLLERAPKLARNLRVNQRRLLSPFDVYQTLRHVPMLLRDDWEAGEPRYEPVSPEAPLARSLFAHEFARNASCADIHVPVNACRCVVAS
jgi:hypothetical protein